MKYIILLLISFNLFAASVEEINAYNLEDYKVMMIKRINPECVITYVEDEMVISDCLPPTEESIAAEFITFKAEQVAIEEARLAKIAAIESCNSRMSALQKPRVSFYKLHSNIPNFALEVKNRCNNLDLDFVTALEAEDVKQVEASTKLAAMNAKIELGELVRAKCQKALSLITGYNLANGLSSSEIDTLQASFSDIQKALEDGRPDKATTLINAMEPNGTTLTQQMKDEVLSVLQ